MGNSRHSLPSQLWGWKLHFLVLPRVRAKGPSSFLTLLWRAAKGSSWPGNCIWEILGANIALGKQLRATRWETDTGLSRASGVRRESL